MHGSILCCSKGSSGGMRISRRPTVWAMDVVRRDWSKTVSIVYKKFNPLDIHPDRNTHTYTRMQWQQLCPSFASISSPSTSSRMSSGESWRPITLYRPPQPLWYSYLVSFQETYTTQVILQFRARYHGSAIPGPSWVSKGNFHRPSRP
jgi:hypothetical protein